MKNITEVERFIYQTNQKFDALRKDVLRTPCANNEEVVELFALACVVQIIIFSFKKSDRIILEEIHGGVKGIMKALQKVGHFDFMSDDLTAITLMFLMFEEMIEDYRRGNKFRCMLGWHESGGKKVHYFK